MIMSNFHVWSHHRDEGGGVFVAVKFFIFIIFVQISQESFIVSSKQGALPPVCIY